MSTLLIEHLLHAMRHGYRCWSETHHYFSAAARGTWREWLCARSAN